MSDLSEYLDLLKRLKEKDEKIGGIEKWIDTTNTNIHDVTEQSDANKRYTGVLVTFAWLVDAEKAKWSLERNASWDNPTTTYGINLANKFPNKP